MIDIQTFATLPAKACFVLLADGQRLLNWMDPATHLSNILNLHEVFHRITTTDAGCWAIPELFQTTRPAPCLVFITVRDLIKQKNGFEIKTIQFIFPAVLFSCWGPLFLFGKEII